MNFTLSEKLKSMTNAELEMITDWDMTFQGMGISQEPGPYGCPTNEEWVEACYSELRERKQQTQI